MFEQVITSGLASSRAGRSLTGRSLALARLLPSAAAAAMRRLSLLRGLARTPPAAASRTLPAVAAATVRSFSATSEQWKQRVARGPTLADFVRADGDDEGDDDERRLAPDESLAQIRAMLQHIRDAVRAEKSERWERDAG